MPHHIANIETGNEGKVKGGRQITKEQTKAKRSTLENTYTLIIRTAPSPHGQCSYPSANHCYLPILSPFLFHKLIFCLSYREPICWQIQPWRCLLHTALDQVLRAPTVLLTLGLLPGVPLCQPLVGCPKLGDSAPAKTCASSPEFSLWAVPGEPAQTLPSL